MYFRKECGGPAVPPDGPLLSAAVHGAGLHHPDEPAGRPRRLRHTGALQVCQAGPAHSAGVKTPVLWERNAWKRPINKRGSKVLYMCFKQAC
jgi:hypothetical protein